MKANQTKPNRSSKFSVRRSMFGVLLPLFLLMAPVRDGFGQPVITRQPTNLSLSIGASATFRVTATTTNGPITYQWRHENTPLLNATNASLTLTNIQMTNAGPYIVAVTDLGGTTNSAAADLDVDPTWTKITADPIVTDQPTNSLAADWTDLDNDGYLDLFVSNSQPGPNPVYHNNGDGTFTRVIEPSLQSIQAEAWFTLWGDYDNDGWPDLFVPMGYTFLYPSPSYRNLLYHNNGNGTFTQVTNNPVVQEGGVSSFGTWADYDRDGFLDLYVVNGTASGATTPAKNWLYHNQGDATFLKLTNGLVGPIVSAPGYYDLANWVDIDNDGWQDLFVVATPASRNRLYRNQTGGGFVEVTGDALVRESGDWGDAEWADYDNDGDLDVFLTTAPWANPTALGPVALFRNDGLGHFTKMTTNEIGSLAAQRANAYVCCWGDYDNDGWLDLYIPNAWRGGETRTDLLYHNNGDGSFSQITRGSPVNELGASSIGWLIDLNHDGFLDLISFKNLPPDNARVRYYRNNGNSNNWLCVRCIGTVSPRSATGTKVRLQSTIRGSPMRQLRVIGLGGFVAAQNLTAHFGLGDATNVDVVRIEWTSGVVQELSNVAVNQYLTVTEPAKLSMPQPGELHILCWKGMAYTIEGSSDLANWTPLISLTNLTLAGGLQWTDPSAATQSVRFYRAQRAEFLHPETRDQPEFWPATRQW